MQRLLLITVLVQVGWVQVFVDFWFRDFVASSILVVELLSLLLLTDALSLMSSSSSEAEGSFLFDAATIFSSGELFVIAASLVDAVDVATTAVVVAIDVGFSDGEFLV